jgi:hypothetical protein
MLGRQSGTSGVSLGAGFAGLPPPNREGECAGQVLPSDDGCALCDVRGGMGWGVCSGCSAWGRQQVRAAVAARRGAHIRGMAFFAPAGSPEVRPPLLPSFPTRYTQRGPHTTISTGAVAGTGGCSSFAGCCSTGAIISITLSMWHAVGSTAPPCFFPAIMKSDPVLCGIPSLEAAGQAANH